MKTPFLSCVTAVLVLGSGSTAANGAEPAETGDNALLHQLRQDADTSELGVLESYNEAVELEKEIAQLYREVRAARLSQIQRQSMNKSLRQTLLPISSRITPDGAVLSAEVKNGDDIAEYQEELKTVMQESDAIVANAEEMLRSLVPEPEPEEESAEETTGEPEETPEETTAPEMEETTSESTESEEEQLEELTEQADQMMDEVEDSLEVVLAEMTQAEKMLDQKLEELAQEDEGQEPAELLKDKLAEARELVETTIESIVEEKEDVEEKVAQTRAALELIETALAKTAVVDKELQETKQDAPQKHTEEAINALEQAQEQMKAASAAAAAAAKLKEAMASAASGKNQEILQQQIMKRLAHAEAGAYVDLTKQMKGQDLNIESEPVPQNQYPRQSASSLPESLVANCSRKTALPPFGSTSINGISSVRMTIGEE